MDFHGFSRATRSVMYKGVCGTSSGCASHLIIHFSIVYRIGPCVAGKPDIGMMTIEVVGNVYLGGWHVTKMCQIPHYTFLA